MLLSKNSNRIVVATTVLAVARVVVVVVGFLLWDKRLAGFAPKGHPAQIVAHLDHSDAARLARQTQGLVVHLFGRSPSGGKPPHGIASAFEDCCKELLPRQIVYQPPGMNACPVETFYLDDVSDPGKDFLVQKGIAHHGILFSACFHGFQDRQRVEVRFRPTNVPVFQPF